MSDSGFKQVKKYTLKFPDAGEFTYYCLVHGMAMKGTVHVRDAGTDYPYTQSQYDRQAKKQERNILRDGNKSWDAARGQADKHTVIAGTDNGISMVMRFVHQEIVVRGGRERDLREQRHGSSAYRHLRHRAGRPDHGSR